MPCSCADSEGKLKTVLAQNIQAKPSQSRAMQGKPALGTRETGPSVNRYAAVALQGQ